MEQGQGEEKTKKIQKDSRDSPSHGLVGVFTPSCCGQTGQTGPGDRSDRSGLQQLAVQTRSTAELLSSTRSLCCDAATSTKYRSAVLEGPRNPGRWLVLRKPPKFLAREDSRLHAVALDAARHLLARSEALDAVDARRLRQSRDRRPSPLSLQK